MYILFLQVHYPWTLHACSKWLVPKGREDWQQTLNCGCILFNAENNIEKHSYFKVLAGNAMIVEDVKTLSQCISPVTQQFIVQLAATNEHYADISWESDYNDYR